jgi:hypothetical protein
MQQQAGGGWVGGWGMQLLEGLSSPPSLWHSHTLRLAVALFFVINNGL